MLKHNIKNTENSILKIIPLTWNTFTAIYSRISYSLTVHNAMGILNFITMGFTDIKGSVIYWNW